MKIDITEKAVEELKKLWIKKIQGINVSEYM